MKYLLILMALLMFSEANAKQFDDLTVIGDRSKPNASAALTINSTTKGILSPRMTTLQRNAIASPAPGLTIFNITTAQPEYHNGLKWVAVGNNTALLLINQVAHGRAVSCSPTPVYFTGGIWTDAKADAQISLATHVIVEVIDVDNFLVAQTGLYPCTGHGLTVDSAYFVSEVTAGGLVLVAPPVYSNPVISVASANTYIVTELRASANTGGGANSVNSVFGRNGNVVSVAGDYTASEITNVPAGNIAALEVQAALNELDVEKQIQSVELDALSALATTGLISRTALGTYSPRTLQATSTKISLVNPDGVAGNPSIDVDETNIDHDNLLNFVLGEHIDWTGATQNLLTSGTVSSGSQNITGNVVLSGLVDGRDVAADGLKLDAIEPLADVTDATNVAAAGAVMDGDFSSNGLMVRTAAGAYSSRTIIAGSAKAVILDGDGVVGNPSIDIDETQIDINNLLNFNANSYVDHSAILVDVSSPDDGLLGGGDITASRILSVDINTLTLDAFPSLIDEFIFFDIGTNFLRKTTLADIVAAVPVAGEANSGVNLGAGANVFETKVGTDLRFRSLIPANARMTVTQNATDISFDVNEGSLDITALGGFSANNYIDHSTVSITGGVGLSGGGALTASSTIDFDIPSLVNEVTIAGLDTIVIYDQSAGNHREMTRSDFLTGLATAPVDSVFGRIGAVVANNGDYGASAITNIPNGNIAAITVQTAIDELDTEKEPVISGAATTITGANLTVSRALVSDGAGKVAVSATTSAELAFVSGVTSSIQTQIDNISFFPEFLFTGGASNVGANSTNVMFYGHTASNGGITMLRNGEITGISITLNNPRAGGTCTASALINGVLQNGVGEETVIDAVNTTTNFQVIAAPIQYVAGDILTMQTLTAGFSPTGSDPTITLYVRDR